MTDEQMKERALFYIDRRINALVGEDVHPGHEQMAAKGMSYADRMLAERKLEERRENDRHEREALEWARAKLREV